MKGTGKCGIFKGNKISVLRKIALTAVTLLAVAKAL